MWFADAGFAGQTNERHRIRVARKRSCLQASQKDRAKEFLPSPYSLFSISRQSITSEIQYSVRSYISQCQRKKLPSFYTFYFCYLWSSHPISYMTETK
ncbi:hypothetical protein BRADI_3g53183v3 [Brachypodium distachyon]|uniref:Uncharacterized protein n=1 Tax=Brachypodium distachyon TaxID=15368 RepID=A0A2K2D4U2_BRADI|nr:hypothetical protein BRADI_3g53183v3 [Brachypodium distachyon]